MSFILLGVSSSGSGESSLARLGVLLLSTVFAQVLRGSGVPACGNMSAGSGAGWSSFGLSGWPCPSIPGDCVPGGVPGSSLAVFLSGDVLIGRKVSADLGAPLADCGVWAGSLSSLNNSGALGEGAGSAGSGGAKVELSKLLGTLASGGCAGHAKSAGSGGAQTARSTVSNCGSTHVGCNVLLNVGGISMGCGAASGSASALSNCVGSGCPIVACVALSFSVGLDGTLGWMVLLLLAGLPSLAAWAGGASFSGCGAAGVSDLKAPAC